MFLLTVDEDEAVFTGGATDLNDSASFLFHGEVAEYVQLDLLSGGDLHLPGAGGGTGRDAVSDTEGQVTVVWRDVNVSGVHTLLRWSSRELQCTTRETLVTIHVATIHAETYNTVGFKKELH